METEELENEILKELDNHWYYTPMSNNDTQYHIYNAARDCVPIIIKHMEKLAEWISEGRYKWRGSYENPHWYYNNGDKMCDTTEQLIEMYFKSLDK